MGLRLKGFKKFFTNPTHSKLYKSLPFTHYESKIRKKLGFTGHRFKKLGHELKDLYTSRMAGGSSSVNSAGAVIPSTLRRSVTDLY